MNESHALENDLRLTLNFNHGWKFQIGDHAGAAMPSYDDASWENVGLPHSFSMPYFAAGNAFHVGYGWHLNLPIRRMV